MEFPYKRCIFDYPNKLSSICANYAPIKQRVGLPRSSANCSIKTVTTRKDYKQVYFFTKRTLASTICTKTNERLTFGIACCIVTVYSAIIKLFESHQVKILSNMDDKVKKVKPVWIIEEVPIYKARTIKVHISDKGD